MGEAVLTASNGFRLSICDEIEGGRYALVTLASCIGAAAKNIYGLEMSALCTDLKALHANLSGAAEMEALEADFGIRFEVGPRGGIAIQAWLADLDHATKFYASAQSDQSYIPAFIHDAGALNFRSVMDV